MANHESLWVVFRTKVLPTLIAACILSTAGACLSLYQKASDVLSLVRSHDQRITHLEKEVVVMKGQMVGWDTLKRIELTLATLSTSGRGNEAFAVMSKTIRNEIEAREEKMKGR